MSQRFDDGWHFAGGLHKEPELHAKEYELAFEEAPFVEYEVARVPPDPNAGYEELETHPARADDRTSHSTGQDLPPVIEPFTLFDEEPDDREASPRRAPQSVASAEEVFVEARPAQESSVAQTTSPGTYSPLSEEDLLSDIQSILNGDKAYDPETKKMKDRQGAPAAASPIPEKKTEMPEFKDEHAIFDRIAQSMKYANAYDLGELELERRFDAFDQESGRETRLVRPSAMSSPKVEGKEPLPKELSVNTSEFLQDLDEVRRRDTPPVAQDVPPETSFDLPAQKNAPASPATTPVRAEAPEIDSPAVSSEEDAVTNQKKEENE